MATNGWAAIRSDNTFRRYRPFIWKEGNWIPCRSFVFYDNSWKMAGKTKYLMIPFTDSDKLFLETYDSEWLLVPFDETDIL